MSDDQARGMRPETTSEHIARDMREGRFPEQSERQMVAVQASPPGEIQVWCNTDTIDHIGTWSTTRYPPEAVTYVRKADAQAAVALVVEQAVEVVEDTFPGTLYLSNMSKAVAAIRAIDPASGVAKLEALRAERDEWKRLAIAGELTARHLTIVQTELAACKELEAVLREALDKARDQGREPDYCYDNEWEYTLRWDEWQDLVDSHDTSEPVEVNTLFKGPTKWVAFVPNSRDEDGNPNDWDAVMVDSEAEARAALAQPSTEGQE